MDGCLLKFTQGFFDIIIGIIHVLIQLLQFLSLLSRFYGKILCNRVDIGHYISYAIDILLSLANYILHEVSILGKANVVVIYLHFLLLHKMLFLVRLVIAAVADHAAEHLRVFNLLLFNFSAYFLEFLELDLVFFFQLLYLVLVILFFEVGHLYIV